MKLSCIICSYNRERFIGEALNALPGQENFDYSQLEIILVNNNSTDKTGDICLSFQKSHPELNIKYFVETSQGLSFARNRGIAESSGEIGIFLDDDAVACKNYFSEVTQFFTEYSDAGAMGGKILPRFETKPPAWMSHFLLPLFALIDKGNKTKLFSDRHYPIGANMAVRKKMFDKYGVFDPNLGRRGNNMEGGEEKDLFLRLRAGGEKIYYCPAPWVYHILPDSRTVIPFLRKQAYGVGYSERIRTGNLGKAAVLARFAGELFRWGASFILLLFYSVTARPAKGITLIRFRWWVTRGFVFKRLN
jgi:glycosyltransferase involved in cell wall biosynthesis